MTFLIDYFLFSIYIILLSNNLTLGIYSIIWQLFFMPETLSYSLKALEMSLGLYRILEDLLSLMGFLIAQLVKNPPAK